MNHLKNKELAHQLECPSGSNGKAIANIMFESNKNMILSSIDGTQINNKNRVLEIGHGNCLHLNYILKKGNNIKYFGLETSELMKSEAVQNQKVFIEKGDALFQTYNGIKIPYVYNFFDRIITVNTLYFWKHPSEFLSEIYRVLKPNGICTISFVNGNFMKKLPFIKSNFKLYNLNEFISLVTTTNFQLIEAKVTKEEVNSKNGKLVNRNYIIATLQKPIS